MTRESERVLDRAAGMLRSAEILTVLTGAGISAESGVPTFRGMAGLWNGRRPEEVATPEAFRDDPEEVWAFYLWRRELVSGLAPNAGHETLARWQDRFRHVHVVTQNVDGLHTAAGSRDVLEIHGSLWKVRCTGCDLEEERRDTLGPSPRCDSCGALLRPAVVWFGESLPSGAMERAGESAISCDVFLSIGTSAVVQPAASLPVLALHAGCSVIEINPEVTPFSAHATLSLHGPAGEVLPELEARLDHD